MNNIQIVKKVFTTPLALEFLKDKKPELFGKRTLRSRIDTYIGKSTIFEEIAKQSWETIKEWTRKYSLENEKGKYYEIKNNLEYHTNNIKKNLIDKKDSPCRPEDFSEVVVKKLVRGGIKKKEENLLKYIYDEIIGKNLLLNHIKERITQQEKADVSEYYIIKNDENIIPTLKHSKGIDMFKLENGIPVPLDIKTTRSIHDAKTSEEAIIKLYEKQDSARFSASPRLYIYMSSCSNVDETKLLEQIQKKYDIKFTYKKTEYEVKGARIAIL